ncbi:MAG: hypothetical protein ACTSQF_01930 [Candidatus Heimdallarchaeaceae archaeon]
MNKEIIKYLPVKVISPFLGVDEGTILEYLEEYGKYVFFNAEEDISDEGYAYANSALTLSPEVIREGIGENFEYVDEDVKTESEPTPEQPENPIIVWKQADMFQRCYTCGHEQVMGRVTDGVSLWMPTNSEAEFALICDSCGTRMELVYKNGLFEDEIVKEQADESQEESD